MEQLLLPVRKAEAGRSTLSVTEPIAKWFGFPEGDSLTSVSLILSLLSFHMLSVHGLQCAFQVLGPFAVRSSVPVFSPEASLLC